MYFYNYVRTFKKIYITQWRNVRLPAIIQHKTEEKFCKIFIWKKTENMLILQNLWQIYNILRTKAEKRRKQEASLQELARNY